MHDTAQGTKDLLALARSRAPEDRERLLVALTTLCRRRNGLSAEARRLVEDIVAEIAAQAQRDIRRRLAEALAGAAWAPHDLVLALALDHIGVAAPVIAQNPILDDADLMRVLAERGLEHQVEVARRPRIGASVVDAILDRNEPSVMATLAANGTADVRPGQMRRLVEASRRFTVLRGPLARHPRLTPELAATLYGWVGDALRARIAERFPGEKARLDDRAGADTARTQDAPADQEAAMERRLVAKLQAAGRLRPGYLLRALREGHEARFEAALETLGGYPSGSVGKALAAHRTDLLALACVGVGIDRSVFPTILSLLPPEAGAGAAGRAEAASSSSPPDAARAFVAGVAAI